MGTRKACIEAYHEAEERYAMLEIKYFSKEQSLLINSNVIKNMKKFGVSPDITIEHNNENENEGIYVIEFHDDYNKKSADFFEKIIKELNIGSCSI